MRLLSMYPKKRCTCIACPIAADIARFLPGPRRASLWGPITLLRERLPLRIKTVHRPDHGWLPHLRGPMPTSSEAGHKHNVASEQLHPRTIFLGLTQIPTVFLACPGTQGYPPGKNTIAPSPTSYLDSYVGLSGFVIWAKQRFHGLIDTHHSL
jgi:hypothetical protein